MFPIVSIITPCFNHGIYLDDAIKSLRLKKYRGVFEHIIIDDGSTDRFTITKLQELKKEGAVIIQQDNKGLGAARNAGIRMARGKYFLPLDSDNLIVPETLLKCCDVLDTYSSVDVVYTDAKYFGDREGIWKVGDIDLLKLLNHNYIDACALVRKKTWEEVGGYDENMPVMGHEDWEFWLNILLKGGKFFYLQEIAFNYRVTPNSMSVNFTRPGQEKNQQYIFRKYANDICKCYNELYYISAKNEKKLSDFKLFLNEHKVKSSAKILLGRKFY